MKNYKKTVAVPKLFVIFFFKKRDKILYKYYINNKLLILLLNNMNNLSFLLEETKTNNSNITINDLIEDMNNIVDSSFNDVNFDDFYAQEINYDTNFTKKELEKILDYYEIPKRRKKKEQMISEIILYEKNDENIYTVLQRKKHWGYIKELKEDTYLRQFIIFD